MRCTVGVAVVAVIVAVAGVGSIAGGAAAQTTSVIQPVRQCGELVGDAVLPEAAVHVRKATVVPAGAGVPRHCEVRGFIEPAVRFQLKLPTSTFTGRYLQYGCGGFCGVISPAMFADCGQRDGGDVVVGATDDGHTTADDVPGSYGSWGAHNQAARNDWFYRAPHVLSVAAKRIIATYYGVFPARSYFIGCSNGGREGLLLAQRYPDDFNGIIAGAPANYLDPLLGVYETWLARTNTGTDGGPVITSAKLPALHRAVLAECDGLDGLIDGQIDDPRACRFDPAALRCPTGTDQPSCLTPAQVDAVRKLYAGPTDAVGDRLYPGGELPGSELAWDKWLITDPARGSTAAIFANGYLSYIGYPMGSPHSSLADFRFTVSDFDRLTPEGVKGNALNLDLEKFRQTGGKLILWHGWADQAIPPTGTLDYYQRLWQHAGGLPQTQQWARLFMVPTMYHCLGGDRLGEFDPFRELVTWVERGTPPDKVIASQRDGQGHLVRSRPVFPYPVYAQYGGTGSIDDAKNFVPAQPLTPPHDIVSWAGAKLYTHTG